MFTRNYLTAATTLVIAATAAFAHPGHDFRPHLHAPAPGHVLIALEAGGAAASSGEASEKVSGQGDYQFRVLHTSSHLPAETAPVLVNAHGGFAVDRRAGKGETYFALPGAGIIQISADFATTAMVPTDPAMRDKNMHNCTIWYGDDGEPFLVFPANGDAAVFTTTLDGKLVHRLDPPTEFNFAAKTVNTYFEKGEKFVPTDVEQLDGLYYIPTGYSSLDYVLTAKIDSTEPFSASWNSVAFGGRGSKPGKFGTGHGVTVPPSKDRIDIADRPNSEIDRFTPMGQYLETVELPKGSFPCDIDYEGDYALVGCLHGPDREKGAPIYLLKDDEVISTIMPKEDLGLEHFQHIHNAVLREVDGKLYIIAQAWNPGDFAILELVGE